MTYRSHGKASDGSQKSCRLLTGKEFSVDVPDIEVAARDRHNVSRHVVDSHMFDGPCMAVALWYPQLSNKLQLVQIPNLQKKNKYM